MHPLDMETHDVEQACNPLQPQDPHFCISPQLPRRSRGRQQCRPAPVSPPQLIPQNLAQEIKKALKRPTVPVSMTPQQCRVSKARPALAAPNNAALVRLGPPEQHRRSDVTCACLSCVSQPLSPSQSLWHRTRRKGAHAASGNFPVPAEHRVYAKFHDQGRERMST
jgi:hypothetical protein